MENSNSREYLEKITAAVIDNLRQTGPVPSVQMQDVPRRPFGGMTDEEEAELDDLDEDENKDVRMTEHRWDKHVVNPAEFEASDDDEMARANGATRINGNKRTFDNYGKADANAITDKHNKTAVASPEATPADDAPDPNDDTIDDIAAAEQTDKEAAPEKAASKELSKDLDEDGDVGMVDSVPPEEPAVIKTEPVEAEAAEENSASNKERTKSKSADPVAPAAAEAGEKANGDDITPDTVVESTEDKPKSREASEVMEVDSEKKETEATKETSPSS